MAAFIWICGGTIGSLLFGAIYDAQGNYQCAFWIAGGTIYHIRDPVDILKQAVNLSWGTQNVINPVKWNKEK
jgi:hypothetical protein